MLAKARPGGADSRLSAEQEGSVLVDDSRLCINWIMKSAGYSTMTPMTTAKAISFGKQHENGTPHQEQVISSTLLGCRRLSGGSSAARSEHKGRGMTLFGTPVGVATSRGYASVMRELKE